jgi:hypothetical protein
MSRWRLEGNSKDGFTAYENDVLMAVGSKKAVLDAMYGRMTHSDFMFLIADKIFEFQDLLAESRPARPCDQTPTCTCGHWRHTM